VKAVSEHGFASSPYPVIITIENHTDEENQGLMANILQSVLGVCADSMSYLNHVIVYARESSDTEQPAECAGGLRVIKSRAEHRPFNESCVGCLHAQQQAAALCHAIHHVQINKQLLPAFSV
jgi:hypothetical protein